MTSHTIAATTMIAAVLVLVGSSVAASDSTTTPHPDVPWQQPMARGMGGVSSCPVGQVVTYTGAAWACTDTVANAGNAATAGYANGAGTADALLPANIPTCPSGYALSGVTGAWTCVNNVAAANNAGYASSAGNGVASVAGSSLNLVNGSTYTLPSGGGNGDPTCSGGYPSGTTMCSGDLYGRSLVCVSGSWIDIGSCGSAVDFGG